MEEPKAGDKASCSMCGAEIEYVGPYWRHVGENQPRHPATPKGEDQAPELAKRSSPASWMAQFETREQKEIDLARLYAAQYDHGSPGHLHLKIIAKLAALLDRHEGIETEYTIERTLVEVPKS